MFPTLLLGLKKSRNQSVAKRSSYRCILGWIFNFDPSHTIHTRAIKQSFWSILILRQRLPSSLLPNSNLIFVIRTTKIYQWIAFQNARWHFSCSMNISCMISIDWIVLEIINFLNKICVNWCWPNHCWCIELIIVLKSNFPRILYDAHGI